MKDIDRHIQLYEWGVRIGLNINLIAEEEFLQLLKGADDKDLQSLFKGVTQTDHMEHPLTHHNLLDLIDIIQEEVEQINEQESNMVEVTPINIEQVHEEERLKELEELDGIIPTELEH